MAGVKEIAGKLSRSIALISIIATATLAIPRYTNAAPINGMGEEAYILLFGPKIYRSPLVG